MSQAVTSDPVLSESDRLDLERRRLECEKLRVEIAQASAPWWTRAGYVGSLVPIVIAIAGFGTGLATGFFDTERKQLQTEIEGLKTTRNDLQKESESLQKQIDDAYLIVRSASAEAAYAISHINAMAADFDTIEPKVNSALTSLSGEEKQAVQQLLSLSEIAKVVADATKEELTFVANSLQQMPASAWVKELQPTIRGQYIPDRVLMQAPDGKLYDPTDGRSYKPEEFGQ